MKCVDKTYLIQKKRGGAVFIPMRSGAFNWTVFHLKLLESRILNEPKLFHQILFSIMHNDQTEKKKKKCVKLHNFLRDISLIVLFDL